MHCWLRGCLVGCLPRSRRRNMKAVLDLGDILGVTGGIRRTDKGELSVTASSLQASHALLQLYTTMVMLWKSLLSPN